MTCFCYRWLLVLDVLVDGLGGSLAGAHGLDDGGGTGDGVTAGVHPLIRSTTPGLETNKHGCIVTDGDDGKTSRDGVYAGGDAVTGAATVIKAMGAGKAAAKAIDEYIQSK